MIYQSPLTSRKPWKHLHKQLPFVFSRLHSKQIIFLSARKTPCLTVPCPKKNESFEVVLSSSLPAHLPKTSHFDFVKACQAHQILQFWLPNRRLMWFQCAISAYVWCVCVCWYLCFFKRNGSHYIKLSSNYSTFQDPSALLPWPQQVLKGWSATRFDMIGLLELRRHLEKFTTCSYSLKSNMCIYILYIAIYNLQYIHQHKYQIYK